MSTSLVSTRGVDRRSVLAVRGKVFSRLAPQDVNGTGLREGFAKVRLTKTQSSQVACHEPFSGHFFSFAPAPAAVWKYFSRCRQRLCDVDQPCVDVGVKLQLY